MNQVFSELQQMEVERGLWQRRVLGYPVWPLLRLERYRAGMLDGKTVIRSSTPRGKTALPQALWKAAVDTARQGMPRGDGRDIWVLSSSTYRRRDALGRYPCIFAEHLTQQLGNRLRFLEVNTAGLPIAGRDDIFLLDGFLRYIHGIATVAAKSLAGTVVSREAAQAFAPISASELVRRAVYGQLLQWLAGELLRIERPRAVFILCAYASMIPILRAVRAANIPIIELQHGVIHDSHPGYIFSAQVPERDHRPDHLVLFGSFFGELLDRHSPGLGATWSVGGHPWLLQARARAEGQLAATVQDRETVVVFGQYDPPVQAQLKRLVPELRSLLPEHVDLIYKPHPREPTEPLQVAFALPGIRIADNAEDSYRLLARCRVSVSVYSTLAIEALAFSCQSVVMRSPYWTGEIRDFVDRGVLWSADDAADIARLLDQPVVGQADIADHLFGVRTPAPDFEALVESLQSR